MKPYKFESANKGEIEICVYDVHRRRMGSRLIDATADCVTVSVENPDGDELYREFNDVRGGCGVDDIFEWLIEQGVKFENPRSAYFNRYYIESVLIDGDETESGAIAYVAHIPESDRCFEMIVAELGTGAFAHVENGEVMPEFVMDADGNMVYYANAVNMMDDDLREELHGKLASCSAQEFFEAYAKAHEEKFGEGFGPYVDGEWRKLNTKQAEREGVSLDEAARESRDSSDALSGRDANERPEQTR